MLAWLASYVGLGSLVDRLRYSAFANDLINRSNLDKQWLNFGQ